jgi:alanine dehydrogenase
MEPARFSAKADLIVKVKEPLAPERAMMRDGQVMFTYFHFAADKGSHRGRL